MTNETEAPERIWLAADLTTYCHDPLGLREDDIEYRRADLPPTREQIMADPRVRALVRTLKQISKWRKDCHEYDLENGHDLREFGEEDLVMVEVWASTALAALTDNEGETE